MSPGNMGVFQLLKEVTLRRILAFYSSRKWGHFGGICARPVVLLVCEWDRTEEKAELEASAQ